MFDQLKKIHINISTPTGQFSQIRSHFGSLKEVVVKISLEQFDNNMNLANMAEL